jgi:hypothetical protein
VALDAEKKENDIVVVFSANFFILLDSVKAHTANILIVENTTFRCVLFPMYIQCIFSTHEMLVVNGFIKCNETTALNTSFTCKKMQ